MRLSELQRKNIINLIDGSFVGRIIDVIIDESGKITLSIQIVNWLFWFTLETYKFFFVFFTESNEVLIKFEQIKKMGSDVILIENINTWIKFFFFIKWRRWTKWKL